MSIAVFLDQLRRQPGRWVTAAGGMQLDAFLGGALERDAALGAVYRRARASLPGPSAAGLYNKVELASPSAGATFRGMLDALEAAARVDEPAVERETPAPTLGGLCGDLCRVVIDRQRPGLMLGEPTIEWLTNYVQGFLAAARRLDPAAASRDDELLASFERWLSERHLKPGARWDALLRVYGAYGPASVTEFAKRWRQFAGGMAATSEAVIETPRLSLRAFVLADAPKLLAMSIEADLGRWMPDQVYADELEASRVAARLGANVAANADPRDKPFVLGIEEGGALIGHVGLSAARGSVEIGYAIAEARRGCGFATEAVDALVGWARSRYGLDEVLGIVAIDNAGSIRVLERAGFQRTATEAARYVYRRA